MIDPLALAQALLRCNSVTPADGGAQDVLAAALRAAGFTVTPLPFGNILNFLAERGDAGPHLCFAGHTDVVPPGGGWRHGAFDGAVENEILYGRGAVDMKGAIAAFAAAASAPAPCRISLLITGDEEGEAINGTARVLEWMAAGGSRLPDFCVVGEPTSRVKLGDTIKIGRRGSLNATITLAGRQGHAAYPQRADNPLHRLLPALAAMAAHRLDGGSEWFEVSTLQITSVDTGNEARNVIPGAARAKLNIRFNDLHSQTSLADWLTEILARFAPAAKLEISCAGEAFLTRPGPATAKLTAAIAQVTGLRPEQNTGGGTSDARFIARYCPVAEFGLTGATMHEVDECVPVAELRELAHIYRALIEGFAA